MKEKITLFIALSFLIGLTAYKKSIDTDIKLISNAHIENEENTVNNSKKNIYNKNKQIENRLICDSQEINTDSLQFSEAFKYYRNCNHDTFIWNGLEYTTVLKSDLNNLNKYQESSINKMDLVSK